MSSANVQKGSVPAKHVFHRCWRINWFRPSQNQTNDNSLSIGLTWYIFFSPSQLSTVMHSYPDSNVHGANMGPTWVLSAPDGPHVGPMNLAIRVVSSGGWNCVKYSPLQVLCVIQNHEASILYHRVKFVVLPKIYLIVCWSKPGVHHFQKKANPEATVDISMLIVSIENSTNLGLKMNWQFTSIRAW